MLSLSHTHAFKFHPPSKNFPLTLSHTASHNTNSPRQAALQTPTASQPPPLDSTMWFLGSQTIGEPSYPFVFLPMFFTILSFFFVVGRLYTRVRISRDLGYDDYCIVAAEVCSPVMMILHLAHKHSTLQALTNRFSTSCSKSRSRSSICSVRYSSQITLSIVMVSWHGTPQD